MTDTQAAQAQTRWVRDALAGAASTLVITAVPITLGMLVYRSFGSAAPAWGVVAAFTTLAVGGLICALMSSSRMPAHGPTSATALIAAGLVVQLAATPGFDPADPAHAAAAVAVLSLAVLTAGLLMLVFAAAGVAALVGYVPRPVLAGFMNGVALMIVLAQIPALLGAETLVFGSGFGAAWQAMRPGALLVGGLTLLTALLLAAWRPQWPGLLIALVAGTGLHHALLWLAPGMQMGGLIGALPSQAPLPDALLPLAGAAAQDLLSLHLLPVLATAALLAVIGTLESLLNLAAVDAQTQHRTDPRRDLLATGLANVANAAFGGIAGLQLRARAVATLRLGGQGRAAALGGVAAAALMLPLGAAALALLPHAVLAAAMVAVAWTLVDRWSLQLLSQWRQGEPSSELLPNLLVVAVVLAVTVFAGFAAAVALGVVLSMALFIRSTNRSLVRQRWRGPQHPSRRAYPSEHEALLRSAREAIEGIQLDGALHFGSVEKLERECRRLGAQTRFLVLDMRRVSTLEASGAVALATLAARLHERGVRMLPCGLADGPALAMRVFGGAELLPHTHPDADRAVEAAERVLLAEAGASPDAPVPLADSLLLRGLDEPARRRVAALLEPRQLQAGERLFSEGDPGDALFVIESGSLALVVGPAGREQAATPPSTARGPSAAAAAVPAIAAPGTSPAGQSPSTAQPTQRYLSASAGMMLGELALLDGGGRSAAAVAEVDSRVLRLGADTLARLRRDDPALAAALLANIALHLSQRLRAASEAWRDAN